MQTTINKAVNLWMENEAEAIKKPILSRREVVATFVVTASGSLESALPALDDDSTSLQ